MLSDLGLKTARSYKVVYGSTKGQGKMDYPEVKGLLPTRVFFLIDGAGVVRGRWVGEDLSVFPTEVILKAAQEMVSKK